METSTAERWLLTTLRADATIGEKVYIDEAPSDAGDTYTLIKLYSAGDMATVNATRIFSNLEYTVKVVGPCETGSLTPPALEAIADQIDTLLHKQRASVSGGEILACWRNTPVSYTEVDEGKTYMHIGGVYQLSVQ